MLLVFLLYIAVSTAFDENCDLIVRVKNGETTPLLSPNFPQKLPPWTSCRWTAFADPDSRVILVCPFYNKPVETKCLGEFNVIPEFCPRTWHCADKGFARIGLNNRMFITYENRLDEPADAFTCYLHSEVNSRWNQTDYEPASQMQHSFTIELAKNDMTQLVAPNNSDPDSSWSNIQWTVTAPADSRIILSCPFTHRPPLPLTIQLAPHRGTFRVQTESGGSKEFHSSEKSIFFSTTDLKMVVTYDNSLGPPDDDFLCQVYSESLTPTETEELLSPFIDCDYMVQIHQKGSSTMLSPRDNVAHEYCRWTFVSTEGSQMKIEGIEPQLSNKTTECGGEFRFQVAGRNVTEYCLGLGFLRMTPTNWVIMINKNLFNHTVPHFRFWLQDVPKKLENESHAFGARGGFENEYEDYIMLLNRRETRLWVSPYYYDVGENVYNASRITVVAPHDCRIIVMCRIPLKDGHGIPENVTCEPDITVVTEDRNNILQQCSGRQFAQSSPNNRMIIIFGSPNPLSRTPFSCEIYAEEKLPWKKFQDMTLDMLINTHCINEIKLPENGRQTLATPNYPWNQEIGPSSCTWNIVAPKGSRVILLCPFRNEDRETQEDESCSSQVHIMVSTDDRPHTVYCRDTAFLRTSLNERMSVAYLNLLPRNFSSFSCDVRAEPIIPEDSCDICNGTVAPPYETCDYIYNLTYHEMRELDFPQHEKPPGTFCRWTVISPPDSRILLSCPYNSDIQEHSCNSHFTVHNGGKETGYCSSNNIYEYSTYNWTVLTYDNPSFDFFPAITCFAYVEKKISSNACINCSALETVATLDYSQCDNTIEIDTTEKEQLLQTPDYPNDMQPGVPCRWTVRSPGTTSISMTCDGLGQYDEEEFYEKERCRGLIVIYGSGPGATFQCRHGSFGTRSTENMLVITYGNQIGLSKKGFQCSITAENSLCRHKIYLRHPHYNMYFQLSTPYWMGKVSPYPTCFWSIESTEGTQLYFRCGWAERRANLIISKTGDENFSDAEPVSVLARKARVSLSNKMTVLLNITKSTKPNRDIGCRIYVDKNPPLGPECDCGNKFNSEDLEYPPNKRRNFAIKEVLRQEYTMIAAIYYQEIENVPPYLLICAATIISNDYAITSANCIEGKLTVQLGLAVGIRSEDRELPLIPITEIILNSESNGNFLGIVRVETPIIFNYLVKPVCMTFFQGQRAYYDENIITLGWGNISYSHEATSDVTLPHALLVAEGDVVLDDNCANLGRFVTWQHTCVIYRKQLDMCQGFEGGPVLWPDPETGLLKLIGVTISHDGCDSTKSKSIAANMTYNLEWVEKTLEGKAVFCKEE